jgi:hypothetical protein
MDAGSAEGSDGRFHVAGGGAALPVVDVIEDDVEFLAGQGELHRLTIVAIGLDIFDAAAQIVTRTAMQHRYGMIGFEKLGDQETADEPGSTYDKAIHALVRCHFCPHAYAWRLRVGSAFGSSRQV